MSDIWLISDQHFNHGNIINFHASDDPTKKMRPGFTNVTRMNEEMIERHNKTVKPTDTVYFGGDIGRGVGKILSRLQGQKIIVLGNHDKLNFDEYRKFSKVCSWKFFPDFDVKFVLTHFPLHPSSFAYKDSGRCFNVHGHIHDKVVRDAFGYEDKRYFNISVERLDYTPIHIETLVATLRERKKELFPQNVKEEERV